MKTKKSFRNRLRVSDYDFLQKLIFCYPSLPIFGLRIPDLKNRFECGKSQWLYPYVFCHDMKTCLDFCFTGTGRGTLKITQFRQQKSWKQSFQWKIITISSTIEKQTTWCFFTGFKISILPVNENHENFFLIIINLHINEK